MDKAATKTLLKFYQDIGVEIPVSDTPVDSFALVETMSKQSSAKPKQETIAVASPGLVGEGERKNKVSAASEAPAQKPLAQVVEEARHLADAASSLAELEAVIRAFDGCSLKKFAQNTVFADGNSKASVMLIGEAPGASEDEQGIPFCGASGKLLDKMLASINLERASSVYISNTIFWRPPGNRVPTKEELAMCLPFVEKHIALIAPKLLIFCGGTSATHMLKSEVGIMKLRGKLYYYNNQYLSEPVQAAVLFHPSFLLRQPGQKRQAWHDLQMIEGLLAG